MNKDIRCWNCKSKFGEIKKGNIEIVSSTAIDDCDYKTEYLEKIKCGRCKSFNVKILRNGGTE